MAQTHAPRLAFVIPAYNEEKLIGQCLEAIGRELDRSKVAAEVVVVNNASVDRTAEIAASYDFVKVVDETKKGLVHARNAGFNATTAELVANIDADTMLPEGWIDTVIAEFEKDDQLVALSGPYHYYDLPMHKRALVKIFYGASYLIYLINRFVLKVGSMIQGGNFVFTRTAWTKAGGYDLSITFYGEDTDIAVRLSRIGKVKWTFGLPMLTSGRRLAEEGVFRTGWIYVVNFFWVTFFGKPRTAEYSDVRPDAEKKK
ncbi:glycosyltransferase family 2 protein [Pelagibacterium lentulum]|uniref:Glycosyltransferase 2-like domain-containing protein n=1 Tax=Pelagibacterium lentulum TaxID=2029865 RepID=A0A916VUI8_9HYPH|nr:glycosyltransferase family A protein [Pelagibacterium lentulum]GGA37047.1 hypothetical protein GCM10011499_02980 [Pelagibacterium lentulum]